MCIQEDLRGAHKAPPNIQGLHTLVDHPLSSTLPIQWIQPHGLTDASYEWKAPESSARNVLDDSVFLHQRSAIADARTDTQVLSYTVNEERRSSLSMTAWLVPGKHAS